MSNDDPTAPGGPQQDGGTHDAGGITEADCIGGAWERVAELEAENARITEALNSRSAQLAGACAEEVPLPKPAAARAGTGGESNANTAEP